MRKSLVAAVLIASSLALASCAMPADDPNWDAEAAAEGVFEEDAEEDAAAEADAAASAVESLANPTDIGVTVPLSAAPEAGALLVSVSDGSEFDTILAASMAEAAETAGLSFQEVAGVDPADVLNTAPAAFEEALALDPAGIRISGFYVDAIAEGLAAAESAGIPVICTGCAGEPSGAIVDTSIDGDAQNTEWAQILSAYVYANKGPEEDAAVEIFTLPAPALATFTSAFVGDLSTLCRECSTLEQPIDETTIGDVPTFVADTMSISLGRWALLESGSVSGGVADALATAVLFEPTVILGRAASAADIAMMQATTPLEAAAVVESDEAAAASEEAVAEGEAEEGTDFSATGTPEEAAALQAWTALPVPVMGWRIVDQFARVLVGDPLADGPLPSQLITPANANDVALDETGNYIGIADYRDQFKTLWGVQ